MGNISTNTAFVPQVSKAIGWKVKMRLQLYIHLNSLLTRNNKILLNFYCENDFFLVLRHKKPIVQE